MSVWARPFRSRNCLTLGDAFDEIDSPQCFCLLIDMRCRLHFFAQHKLVGDVLGFCSRKWSELTLLFLLRPGRDAHRGCVRRLPALHDRARRRPHPRCSPEVTGRDRRRGAPRDGVGQLCTHHHRQPDGAGGACPLRCNLSSSDCESTLSSERTVRPYFSQSASHQMK